MSNTQKVKKVEESKDLMVKKYSLISFEKRFNESLKDTDLIKIHNNWIDLEKDSFHLGAKKIFTLKDFMVNKLLSKLASGFKKKIDKAQKTNTVDQNDVDQYQELCAERSFYASEYSKDNPIIDLFKNGFHDKTKETGGIHRFAMKVKDNVISLIVGESGGKESYFSKVICTFNGNNTGFYDCIKSLSDTKVDPLGYQAKNGRFFRFVVTNKKRSDGFKLQYNDVVKNEWITLSGAGETNVKNYSE